MEVLGSSLKCPISHLILCGHFTSFIILLQMVWGIGGRMSALTSSLMEEIIPNQELLSQNNWELSLAWTTNLGQGIVGKFTKLSTIGFCRECFTDDYSQFSKAIAKICPLGGRLVTLLPFQAFQGFLWNFLISWISSRWAIGEATPIFNF